MDIGLVQVKSLLAIEERIAFLQNRQSHVIHAPRLEGITQVSDGGRVVGQVFHNLVVLLLGLVVLALHGIDIDQIDHRLIIGGILLDERLKFALGLVVILQMKQAFDILLEMTQLSRLFVDFFVQITGLFVVLLSIVLGSQLFVDLDLLFLFRIHFLAFGWHGNLGTHLNDEGEIKEQNENPVFFHGGAQSLLFLEIVQVLAAVAQAVLEILYLTAQLFHLLGLVFEIDGDQ